MLKQETKDANKYFRSSKIAGQIARVCINKKRYHQKHGAADNLLTREFSGRFVTLQNFQPHQEEFDFVESFKIVNLTNSSGIFISTSATTKV